MDLKRREIMASKDEASEPENAPVSERPLTARLFDALFPGKRK
ncbi:MULTISPECIES: hypothetical protein [Sinorhizobium]|nr:MULTISPECIES: hypothetical protein [Sinorhizobium]